MRTIKRIIKIHEIRGYKVYCLFNNGESRVIDFEALFKSWAVKKGDLEYVLLESEREFDKVKLVDGTLSWEGIKIKSKNEKGKDVTYNYELDPIVLYENSVIDETRDLELGMLIRKARKEKGLTQEALARKSGTTKHYISKLENNKIGIELSTLKKIIEGGLGKRMRINIM
jgi:DNA-binding XRE family transcriptional regulator